MTYGYDHISQGIIDIRATDLKEQFGVVFPPAD